MRKSRKIIDGCIYALMALTFFSTVGVTKAWAVHDLAFELDANTVKNGVGTFDWESLFNASGTPVTLPDNSIPGFVDSIFTKDGVLPDPSTFSSGSKDVSPVSSWQCAASSNVLDKDDLQNVYATTYVSGPNAILYFGAERLGHGGNANIAIWFLQDDSIGCTAPGTFTGHHTDGDLLMVASFTNGGSVTNISVYKWQGNDAGSLNTTAIISGADCSTAGSGDDICAAVNSAAFKPLWDSSNVDQAEFFEGGANLAAIFSGGGSKKFSKFLVDTRASSSLTSELHDYALGSLSLRQCETASDCDDGITCTVDACGDSGFCEHTPASVETSCNDGDACTTADHCDGDSKCVGGPALDCNDNNACSSDSCDKTNGCQHVFAEGCQACSEQADCDNHDACDGVELCSDGKCQSGTPPDCDDGSLCTTDSCDKIAGCLTSGVSCDDNDACTADSCDPITGCGHTEVVCDDANACTADACDPDLGCTTTPISCDDNNPCTIDSCDAVLGCKHDFIEGCKTCSVQADCDNNDACDGVESCQGGTCHSGTPPDCSDTDKCTNNSCDPAIGCVITPVVCGDQNACTKDSCDPKVGCTYTPISCDDSNKCTADSCDETTGCATTPISCDDADACTADSCDPATGCAHNPVSCDDHNPCTADSCDTSLGCLNTPIDGCIRCENDGDCSNNNLCDGIETCGDDGTCHAGTPPDCADTTVCTTDSCDPISGCLHKAISCDDSDECTADSCDAEKGCGHDKVSCDDSNACTADSCDPKAGCSHTSVSCDDNNPCTIDSCDAVNGCQHTLIDGCKQCESPADCDNKDACDGLEQCIGGTCQSGKPPVCEDSNACTTDSCDKDKGCVNSPLSCDDSDACTADSCDSKSGCGHEAVSCDDNNACTADSCDPSSGCAHDAVSCDDHDACTIDSCDPEGGCQHELIEGCKSCSEQADCNDGNACDGQEQCVEGVCQSGDPLLCNDENPCTSDSCDPESGCVNSPIDGCKTCSEQADCDDHNACNGVEECGENGICVAGHSLDCNDSDTCTADSCNPETGCVHVSNGCNQCPDQDNDGICDDQDNCIKTFNPDQADSNGNHIGDACEQGGDNSGVTGSSNCSILEGAGGGASGGAPKCSGFCSLVRRSPEGPGKGDLFGCFLLVLALAPWTLRFLRVPGKQRRSLDY